MLVFSSAVDKDTRTGHCHCGSVNEKKRVAMLCTYSYTVTVDIHISHESEGALDAIEIHPVTDQVNVTR